MFPLNHALALLASLAGLAPARPEPAVPAHTTARGRAFDIHVRAASARVAGAAGAP
jgi:hypothetical protein